MSTRFIQSRVQAKKASIATPAATDSSLGNRLLNTGYGDDLSTVVAAGSIGVFKHQQPTAGDGDASTTADLTTMTSMAGAGQPTAMNSEQHFARLRKDVLFHYQRLKLLLTTNIVDDLGDTLKEKLTVRSECLDDCRGAVNAFESAASNATLSGTWDEGQIRRHFKLEVPPRMVVGGAAFEAPEKADAAELRGMVARLREISERYPEFTDEHCGPETVQTLQNLLDTVEFTSRDVTKMKAAVSAKLQVLSELDDLTQVLEESACSIAEEQKKLEDIRRAEFKAKEDGEVASADQFLIERQEHLQRIIDLTFFQAHTVNSTIDANSAKRSSNVALFQATATTLQSMATEKETLIGECDKDLRRIDRGVAYKDREKEAGRGEAKAQLDESRQTLAAFDEKQKKLCARLQDLYGEFAEVEQALVSLADERAAAVQAHTSVVERSRHAHSDFTEMERFAGAYKTNLESTRAQYAAGIGALRMLEKVLLQSQKYDAYDFQASGKRLRKVRGNVCGALNSALNDYEAATRERLRRCDARLAKVTEAAGVAAAEAEVRMEIFDPLAKKYTQQAKALAAERDELQVQAEQLQVQLKQQRESCLAFISEHVKASEVTTIDKQVVEEDLRRREARVDGRQHLLDLKTGPTGETLRMEAVTLEREAQQTTAVRPSELQKKSRDETAKRMQETRRAVDALLRVPYADVPLEEDEVETAAPAQSAPTEFQTRKPIRTIGAPEPDGVRDRHESLSSSMQAPPQAPPQAAVPPVPGTTVERSLGTELGHAGSVD